MNATHGQCDRCGDTNSLEDLACTGCGGRLPWADAATAARREQQAQAAAQLVLDQQAAIAAQQAAQQAAYQAQQVAYQAQQAHLASLPRRGEHSIPGKCPSCGQERLVEFRRKEADDGSLQSAACCLGFFFFPLLLAAPFLARRGKTTFHRRCLSCNHQWQI